MINIKIFYRWIVSFCFIVSMFVLALNEGVISTMFDSDISHLSVVITVLFFACSIFAGYLSLKKSKLIGLPSDPFDDRPLRILELCKGHFFTLGILGTVAGLIFMTNDVLKGDDVQKIIIGLKDGLATALFTTAAGIIASVLTHIQIFILTYDD